MAVIQKRHQNSKIVSPIFQGNASQQKVKNRKLPKQLLIFQTSY